MADFRIRFTTRDGCLVMNRHCSMPSLFKDYYGRWDVSSVPQLVSTDLREKGVKLISCTLNDSGVDALVDWL